VNPPAITSSAIRAAWLPPASRARTVAATSEVIRAKRYASRRDSCRPLSLNARAWLAGPLLGGAGAAIVAVAAALTHDHLLFAVAYTGFFLNLFNLIPVTPLDGGRAMAAMAPAMWLVGLVVLIGAYDCLVSARSSRASAPCAAHGPPRPPRGEANAAGKWKHARHHYARL
jgi:hypothetical protein